MYHPKFEDDTIEDLLKYIAIGTDDRIYGIASLLRKGCSVEKIASVTAIDLFFLRAIERIVNMEKCLAANPHSKQALQAAKKMGFSDKEIACLWNTTELAVFNARKEAGILPVYKMIDTCSLRV